MEFYKETEFQETEIGRIPKEWRASSLGQETDIIMGQSPPSSTYNDKGIGIPFYQGNVDFGEIHPSTRIFCSEPRKIAEKDNILISVRAPVGELNIADSRCCIGRGLAAISMGDEHSRDFIYYVLKHFNSNLIGQGSTFKAIGKDDMNKFAIPIPNKKEEFKIASVLSSLETLIRYTDSIIRKTQELKKGLMQELLTKGIGHKEFKYSEEFGCEIPKEWKIGAVSEICHKPEYGYTQSATDKKIGPKFLRITDIQDGKVEWDNVPFCLCPESFIDRYRAGSR